MYKALRIADTRYLDGLKSKVVFLKASTQWVVIWEDEKSIRVVLMIPDFYQSPESIAKGVAAQLNKGGIVLDLLI
jgi:hypothetical protein